VQVIPLHREMHEPEPESVSCPLQRRPHSEK
jgi:hypothetical protein